MANRKPSQEQQETAPTSTPNPFAAMPGMELWTSMMDAQAARFESMLGQMEKVERERNERALSAVEDLASLVKTSLSYQQQLADEWRKLGLEAARKSAAMMGTRG